MVVCRVRHEVRRHEGALMPIGSPLPPRKAKIEADKLEERKRLLESRRNPTTKAKVKFRARMQRYSVEVMTGVTDDGTGETGRDIPFKVDAINTINAVRLVLEALKLREGEFIHSIHIGEPQWLPREPVGRQDGEGPRKEPVQQG